VGAVLTIYAFKVRQFFGPLRSELGAVVIVTLLAVSLLPPMFFVGYFAPTLPIWQSANLGELFAVGLSAFLAFDLLFSLSGGTLTHPAEIDFFATSRLRPRQYVVADYLFQFTVTNALAIPALLVVGLGLSLRLGNGSEVVAAILAFLAFTAAGLALGQSVGLAIAARRRGAKILAVGLVVLLMIPAGHQVWPFLPSYQIVPLPSAAAAYLILALLFGGTLLPHTLLLTAFALIAGIAWFAMTSRDVFPYLRPTMRIAFGQMNLQSKVAQQEALIRGLSRLTRRVSPDLLEGPPVAMMTRLHLTRTIRDGSVLIVALITGVLALISAASRVDEPAPSELTLLSTGWVAVMIPVILAFNWNVMDRANLWTVAMSPRYFGAYFRGMYRTFLILTGVGAVVGAVAGGAVSILGALAATLMSLAACGAAVVVFAAVKIPTDAFSLKAIIPFLVVPLIALAAGAPAVALALFASSPGPWSVVAWPIAISYAIGILVSFDRLVVAASRRFQL